MDKSTFIASEVEKHEAVVGTLPNHNKQVLRDMAGKEFDFWEKQWAHEEHINKNASK